MVINFSNLSGDERCSLQSATGLQFEEAHAPSFEAVCMGFARSTGALLSI